MGGFHVDHAALREHAAHIEEIGSSVGQASEALSTINLSGGAFGLMCSFRPPVLGWIQQGDAAAIAAATGTLSDVAEGVRTMADNYQLTDQAIAEGMNSVEPE